MFTAKTHQTKPPQGYTQGFAKIHKLLQRQTTNKKEITYKKKHESKNKGISSYAILAKVHPVEGNTMTAIQTYCSHGVAVDRIDFC